MKKLNLIFGIILIAFLSVNAQYSKTIDAEDIVGTDSIIEFRFDDMSDLADYHWLCMVTSEETDTFIVDFGGRIRNGNFEAFESDSLPYTIQPGKIMNIEGSDTAYQKVFSGGLYTYEFKTPMIKITPGTATGNIVIDWFFFRK